MRRTGTGDTSVSPTFVRLTATNLVANVTGTGFTPGANVVVFGLRRTDVLKTTTTYVDDTHLQVTMSASSTIAQSPYDSTCGCRTGEELTAWGA